MWLVSAAETCRPEVQLSLDRAQLGVVHAGCAVGKADNSSQRARNMTAKLYIYRHGELSSDEDEVKADDCRGRVDDGKVHDKRDAQQTPAASAFAENTTTTPTPATLADSTVDTQVH